MRDVVLAENARGAGGLIANNIAEKSGRGVSRPKIFLDYWGKPGPVFGDWNAPELMLWAFRTGRHGSKVATGRPFSPATIPVETFVLPGHCNDASFRETGPLAVQRE